MVVMPLVYLRQALLALALHGWRPAMPVGAKPRKERKPMGRGQAQEGRGLGLDFCHLAAALQQEEHKVLGHSQTGDG